jgi:hypothetical protein
MVSKFPKLIGFFVIGTLMISLVTFAILNILPEGNLSLEYDSEHINENLEVSQKNINLLSQISLSSPLFSHAFLPSMI